MVKVEITCPVCSKYGIIEVEENIIAQSKRGVAAVNVSTNLVCEHSFIAYIDKNFYVRDAFITDFTVELPEMDTVQQIDMNKIPSKDIIDTYLIRINVHAHIITYLLRCFFNGKKVIYINNVETVKKHLTNLFDYIFKDTFPITFLILNRDEYREDKKKYKDFVVINTNNKVIQDKEKIINHKNLKIENVITQKFLTEQYPKTSLIILKNEIIKAFELSNEIIKFNNSLNENEEFTSKRILDHFQETMHVKVGREYLDFLTNIVNNYHKVKLAKSSDVSDFLGY